MEPLTILHLEDDPMDQELVAAALKSELDCTVEAVSTRDAFTHALAESAPDVVLLDYQLPGFDGLTALDLLLKRLPDTPVVFVSGTIGDELAVRIIKHGANDYVLKDRLTNLPSAVLRAVEENRTRVAYRESQEALRVSEQEYRDLIDRMPAATFVVAVSTSIFSGGDLRPRLTFLSPQLCKTLGLDPEVLVAHPEKALSLVHPDDLKRTLAEATRSILTGRPVSVELRSRAVSGEYVWIRAEATFSRDRSARTATLSGFVTDISERKQAQDELLKLNQELEQRVERRSEQLSRIAEDLKAEVEVRRLAEARLDRALRYAPLPTMLHAEDGQILLVNESWKEITGYSEAEMTTIEAWLERAHGERDDVVAPMIERLYQLEEPINEGESAIIVHDGTTRVWEFHSAPLGTDSSGRRLVITMARDVTEAKQIEQDLITARMAAETANVAKSNFLASMSHELRTPLGTIIGFAQLLQEKLFGDLNEKQDEQIAFVLESARHLLSLINDILDLSKIEAGKMDLRPSVVDLSDLLEGSLDMLKEQCLRKGVTLTLELGSDAHEVLISADERMLKQIMYNLLSNAAKFTPRGGRIVVSQRVDRDEVVVSVADTGIGIAPDQQEFVFGEFNQVNSSVSGKTAGTGLGLSLVTRLVGMHGGRVWVESDGTDKGATFSFSLPPSGRKEPIGDVSVTVEPPGELTAAIGAFCSRHDRVCVCRFEPFDPSTPFDGTAMEEGLKSGKRSSDVVVQIGDEGYALLLTDTDRPDAERACRRIAHSLEKELAMPWRWAIAMFPEDAGDPKGLIEMLAVRIGRTP